MYSVCLLLSFVWSCASHENNNNSLHNGPDLLERNKAGGFIPKWDEGNKIPLNLQSESDSRHFRRGFTNSEARMTVVNHPLQHKVS